MAKSSRQIIVLFLIAIVCLTNSLKIRNDMRCLKWKGSQNKNPILVLVTLTDFIPCSTNDASLVENGWVQIPGPNGSFNLCVQNSNMCLDLTPVTRNKQVRIEAFTAKRSDGNLSQQWKFDGSKLTNARMGPDICAQAENNIVMVPCNATEPKQKFEIQ